MDSQFKTKVGMVRESASSRTKHPAGGTVGPAVSNAADLGTPGTRIKAQKPGSPASDYHPNEPGGTAN